MCSIKKRVFVILFLSFLILSFRVNAQQFSVNADLVSTYMWRGIKCGSASVQPSAEVAIKGFSAEIWGSTEFSGKNNEIDLTLAYEYKKLTFILTDMYIRNDDERSNFFNYRPHTTGHTLEPGIMYTVSDKFPLSAAWYTIIAGNDYKENQKRAWSSYLELKYPFRVAEKIELEAEAGLTPWKGLYANRFNVSNLALKATREIRVTPHFSFSIFGQLVVNPHEKKSYFVAGVTL